MRKPVWEAKDYKSRKVGRRLLSKINAWCYRNESMFEKVIDVAGKAYSIVFLLVGFIVLTFGPELFRG